MDSFPINPADGIVVAVLLLSGLVAFGLGFIRVMLFVACFLGSILATLYLFPLLSFIARDHIELQLLADAVTVLSIFVVVFVVLSTVGQLISRRVKETGMGFLDRTLGFAVGLAFGAVVVSFAYLMLVWLLPPEDHPEWVREARALPLVIYGGQLLERLAPDDVLEKVAVAARENGGEIAPPLTFDEVLRRLIEPVPAETPTDSAPETGYKSEERKQLDRLFEAQEAN